ncbi:MAG TPA: hypothetical protein PK819_06410, partial [Thermomicrobiales bacterium]|nr:hypothetical protein [Thermomicrobiales bacterium]
AAEQKMRSALSKLAPGRREFVDHLDDGTPVCVAITVHGDTATIASIVMIESSGEGISFAAPRTATIYEAYLKTHLMDEKT